MVGVGECVCVGVGVGVVACECAGCGSVVGGVDEEWVWLCLCGTRGCMCMVGVSCGWCQSKQMLNASLMLMRRFWLGCA